MGDNAARGCVCSQIGRQPATRVDIRHQQQANIVAIVTGDYSVANERSEVRDDAGSQRTDADPGSRRQLEVFLDAAVEYEAGRNESVLLLVETETRNQARDVIGGR